MPLTDDIARYNQERWNALVASGVEYSRPMMTLNAVEARKLLDPYNVMGMVEGKDALCLAGGGGQQSVAFGLLGAKTTVVDFSEAQLARDREALAHYGLHAGLFQMDIRDLSAFSSNSFDIVWHAYSINFIPDVNPVFNEVARVLRPGGLYHTDWSNPFFKRLDERDWDGAGYPLKHFYADGEVISNDNIWEIESADGSINRIKGPREFNHTLGTILNGLIGRGFQLLGLWEEWCGDPDAEPGSWEHYKAVAPQMLNLWARYEGGHGE